MSRRRGGVGHPWEHAPTTWPHGPFQPPAGTEWPHAEAAAGYAAAAARAVRTRRRDREWSRTHLAGRAGVSVQTVSAVERGAVWPDLVTLTGLAEALEVSVQTLLDGDIGR